jgi:predicted dehydrogenase
MMAVKLPLRGVVIGAGYFAKYHCEAWTRIPQVKIAAICDLSEAKARELMPANGIPAFSADWRDLIDRERPDFIDIVTRPDTHEEMCAHAAESNAAIICQKPLAPTFEASRRIVENAKAAGVRFMVHENWRWQPWYRKIKQLQRDGFIGEFTHLYFRMRTGDGWGEHAYLDRQPFFRDYPRLLVYETGVHFVDTFRFLLGEVVEVYANLRRLNPVIRGEDAGQVVFRFASGATALWDANRYNEVESASPRYTFGELRIDASGGHLTMDTASNLRVKPLGGRGVDVDYTRQDVNFAGDCVYATERHFIECLLSGAEFETSGDEYLKTLRAVDAIYESAASGLPVRLD